MVFHSKSQRIPEKLEESESVWSLGIFSSPFLEPCGTCRFLLASSRWICGVASKALTPSVWTMVGGLYILYITNIPISTDFFLKWCSEKPESPRYSIKLKKRHCGNWETAFYVKPGVVLQLLWANLLGCSPYYVGWILHKEILKDPIFFTNILPVCPVEGGENILVEAISAKRKDPRSIGCRSILG